MTARRGILASLVDDRPARRDGMHGAAHERPGELRARAGGGRERRGHLVLPAGPSSAGRDARADRRRLHPCRLGPGTRRLVVSRAGVPRARDPLDVGAFGGRDRRCLRGPRVHGARGGCDRPLTRRGRHRRRQGHVRAGRGQRPEPVLPARPAGGRRVAHHRSARRHRARPGRVPERLPPLLGDVLRPHVGVPRAGRALVPDHQRDGEPRQRAGEPAPERLAGGIRGDGVPRERLGGRVRAGVRRSGDRRPVRGRARRGFPHARAYGDAASCAVSRRPGSRRSSSRWARRRSWPRRCRPDRRASRGLRSCSPSRVSDSSRATNSSRSQGCPPWWKRWCRQRCRSRRTATSPPRGSPPAKSGVSVPTGRRTSWTTAPPSSIRPSIPRATCGAFRGTSRRPSASSLRAEGSPIQVADAWSGATQISAMSVSRDGARIAAVVTAGGRTAVWVAGIVRGADQLPVRLGLPVQLGTVAQSGARTRLDRRSDGRCALGR